MQGKNVWLLTQGIEKRTNQSEANQTYHDRGIDTLIIMKLGNHLWILTHPFHLK